MDIFAEEFRINMLRVMNNKIAAKEDTLLEAEKTVAKLRDECGNLKIIKSRLENEECPSLVCPSCFYERYTSSALRPIPFRTSGIDLFKCKSCNSEWGQPD